MNERYKPRSYHQALSRLVEELGEATAAAGKTLRWGPNSVNPELPPEEQEENIDWLRRELKDVQESAKLFFELYENLQ